MTSPAPVEFGKYTLLRPLGRPGGTVWLAAGGSGHDTHLCVVKRAVAPVDAAFAGHFREQARALLALDHPNLVRLVDAGQVYGDLFLAMELVEGRDLRAVEARASIRRKPLPLGVVLHVGQELCRGLAHAHARGIAHRNLAPANVVLAWAGGVKLVDFALPWTPRAEAAWLAPEAQAGRQGDLRTDVWGVGAILWELLAGRPFPGWRPDRELPPPSRFATVPPGLETAVMRALAAEPAARPARAEELGATLAAMIGGAAAILGPSDRAMVAAFLRELFADEIARDRSEGERLVSEVAAQRPPSSLPGPVASPPPRPTDSGVPPIDGRLMEEEDVPGDPDAEHYVGQVIGGRYRVISVLGQGGMGWVYEVEHIELGKRLALKVLLPRYSRQAHLVQRFRQEARAASTIGHPNIVDVTDFGTTSDGNFYFVMEKLEGVELGMALYHERRLPPERAVHVAVQMCRALAAAHAVGIIHRDLKPENVFLTTREGEADFVKVLDFGIAKGRDEANPHGRRGAAMGTPEYMAPEQAAGKPVDGRIDVYSVGAILYEMVTGQPPHVGPTAIDIINRKGKEPPRPVRELNPAAPEALERVILACLEIEPERRPQTMAELEYELTKCMRGRSLAVAQLLGIRAGQQGDAPWPVDPPAPVPIEVPPSPTPSLTPEPAPSVAALESAPLDRAEAKAAAAGGAPALAPVEVPRLEPELRPEPEEAPRPHAAQRVPWAAVFAGAALISCVAGGVIAWRWRRLEAQVARLPEASRLQMAVQGSPSDAGAPSPKAPRPSTATAGPRAPEVAVRHAVVETLEEWARRALDGGRLIAPPGDNLKELLERIDAADPGNATAAALRTRAAGALRQRAGDGGEGVDDLRALAELDPADASVRARLGRALADRATRRAMKHQIEEALADGAGAVELLPDDAAVRGAYADALWAAGRRDAAADQYRRVLAVNAGDGHAKRRLSEAEKRHH